MNHTKNNSSNRFRNFLFVICLFLQLKVLAQSKNLNADIDWRNNRNQWLNKRLEISSNRPLGNMQQFFGSTINISLYGTYLPIRKNTFIGIGFSYGFINNRNKFGV
jgi:hypothetical protein